MQAMRALVVLSLAVGLAGVGGSVHCQTEAPNLAAASNGATVTGPQNSSASAGRPLVANDGRFDGYCWAYLDTPLTIHFPEPRTINSLDVLLHHGGTYWYRFRVEVSSDGQTWHQVADRTSGEPSGWQRLDFAPVECRQVRLTFTDTNVEARSYHVVEVGAFLLPEGEPSPLRAAQERYLREEVQGWDDILLRCLGPDAIMPEEQRERVLGGPPGQRFPSDLDGDGDPDVMDFVDPDPRHTIQPMLVRVLDDDDDMPADGTPDEDSDCYVADHRGDGSTDRAVDYWDDDSDDDVDRQDIYYRAGTWHGKQVEVVVISDIGDDNRLWWTRNYEYDQYTCQWKSDFNGDEIFCMFGYDRTARRWVAHLEEPFTHHDLDGDGVAELTMQFMGTGLSIATLRYSLDADNDSHPRTNRRDYDFSFNCTGLLTVPLDKALTYTLRNGDVTGPSLAWQHAREQAERGGWRNCRLCWDEVDNNVNPADKVEREQERWEGVGGYPMREGNKRWETDQDYSGGMRLYYWPVDGRLHLMGADTGYIEIDINHDYRLDAKLNYADRDGDGHFDQWAYDADADSRPDYVATPPPMRCELVAWEPYPEFTRRYRGWVQKALAGNERLIAALKSLLGAKARSTADEWWCAGRLEGFYAARKLGMSAEARRYYLDLTRLELFLQAREAYGQESWWPAFAASHDSGDLQGAADVLAAPR